jgi:hypothetical protein
MLSWGVEDLDLGLKCWLSGARILHDSEAVVGHRFRKKFDTFAVPVEHLLANQLRMANKNFGHSIWRHWLRAARRRYSAGNGDKRGQVWEKVWGLFRERQSTSEQERTYLAERRTRDELWYAEHFRRPWPRLAVPEKKRRAIRLLVDPSPDPPCTAHRNYSMAQLPVSNLIGIAATISTHYNRLCGELEESTDIASESVWVSLGSSDDSKWGQAGYIKYRNGSATIYTARYAEIRGNGYNIYVDTANAHADGSSHSFQVDLDTSTGIFTYFEDGSSFHTFHDGYWTVDGALAVWAGEIYNLEDKMAGTTSNPCTITNCQYRAAGGSYQNAGLTSGNVSATDATRCAAQFVSGTSFDIWDLR